MSVPTALQIATALDLIAKAALTTGQVVDLLNNPRRTVADVEAQLDRTASTIDQHRREN